MLSWKRIFGHIFIQCNKHFTVLVSSPLEQWQKFFSYQKVFIITISCPLCLRELSGSSNPTKSATHVNAKKFYNEREFRSWYFDVNCDKMQFKPITRRLLYLKRKYFYGCQKFSFKFLPLSLRRRHLFLCAKERLIFPNSLQMVLNQWCK